MNTLNQNQLGKTGKYGEDTAADYLISEGYTILARNVKYGKLELDIVAEDETHIVFIEVKSRTIPDSPGNGRYGPPSSSIDREKRRNTVSASRLYLHEHRPEKLPRIDVIEVYLKKNNGDLELIRINHIRNAITADR